MRSSFREHAGSIGFSGDSRYFYKTCRMKEAWRNKSYVIVVHDIVEITNMWDKTVSKHAHALVRTWPSYVCLFWRSVMRRGHTSHPLTKYGIIALLTDSWLKLVGICWKFAVTSGSKLTIRKKYRTSRRVKLGTIYIYLYCGNIYHSHYES